MSGALAGIDIDMVLVRFPAWRKVGAAAWAAYSREADLGAGLILYPALATGSALLCIAAVVGLHRGSTTDALPAAYSTLALTLVGLLLTIRAAPIMLSLKHGADDRATLETAFRGFRLWSSWRALAQILAFVASLWLFARISA